MGQEVAAEEEQGFLAESTLQVPAPTPVFSADVHIGGSGTGSDPTDCPGTAAAPTAKPGSICLYPTISTNASAVTGWPVVTAKGTGSASSGAGAGKVRDLGSRYGFAIRWTAHSVGESTVAFVWAYTAPSELAPEEESSASSEKVESPLVGGWNQVTNTNTEG